ncbi:hypothetical protein ACET3Z_028480 [Daucus carota]
MKENIYPCTVLKSTASVPQSLAKDLTGIGGKHRLVDTGRQRQHSDDKFGHENNAQRSPMAPAMIVGSNGSGRSWTEYLKSNYARMPLTALRPLIKVVDNKDSIEIFSRSVSILQDDKILISSEAEGVEFLAINLITVSFSLDQIKEIEGKLGVVQAGGINKTFSIQWVLCTQPLSSSEYSRLSLLRRTVFYLERAARMYSVLPYAVGQVLFELPYSSIQTIL